MDMNSVSKNSIEKFLRDIFNSNPNFGQLTKAELRSSYIQEKGLTELSGDEKIQFSSVVNEVINEFMGNTGKSKVSHKSTANDNAMEKSKSSKQKKRIYSDDESELDMSEIEHDKENVDSTNTKNQSYENAVENSDSDVSHSDATLESETEHQNKQTVDKLPEDTQQVSHKSLTNGNATTKSEASKQKKRIYSDDESETDMSETKHNKENVDSTNGKNQLDKNTVDNSDSDVSRSDAALESETEHRNKETVDKLPEDTQQVSHKSLANGNATAKSKASKQKKRIYSDDESETEHNKENLDSTNGKNQLDKNTVDNSDSDVSRSDAALESETEHQNKQTANKLPKDTQQGEDECGDKISASDANSSDDDFASKSNFEKRAQKKTQRLNSYISDIDANKNLLDADVPSSDSIEDKKISSKKRKKSMKESAGKPRKQQKIAVDDSSSDSDSSIPVTKEKMKKNLQLKTSKKANLEVTSKAAKQNGHDISSGSEEEQELQKENAKGKNKKSKPDGAPKSKKSPPTNSRIENLKKYLRTAGLRIPSYDKLFESCHSQKAKIEKLLEVLNNAGMKGKPTMEKCKKLKKKIETKKDIESLNLSNIIKTEGRPKRNVRSLYLDSPSPAMDICDTPTIDHFSSLKDIIDSDESDTPVKVVSRVKNVISDDDDF